LPHWYLVDTLLCQTYSFVIFQEYGNSSWFQVDPPFNESTLLLLHLAYQSLLFQEFDLSLFQNLCPFQPSNPQLSYSIVI